MAKESTFKRRDDAKDAPKDAPKSAPKRGKHDMGDGKRGKNPWN